MYYGKKCDPFYQTVAWRRLRVAALQRDFYTCQDCLQRKAQGETLRARRATVVHHIQPREARPDLAMDLDNLVSLCDACHAKRHPEKGERPRQSDAPTRARVIKV